MMRRLLILAAWVLAPAFLSCEGGGNSGSETTNGLTGTVKDVEGRPIAGARILVLPEEFNPGEDDTGDSPLETRTDADGVYMLTDVEPGAYHLEASDSVHGTVCLIQDVTVSAGSAGLRIVDGVLGMPGSLVVRIADFLGSGESGYVYMPGTTELLRLDASSRESGSVTLPGVPVGRFDRMLLVIEGGTDKRVITLAENFEVLAESAVTTAAFQTWAHSRRIPVNTVDLGVAGAVLDFPLLVRLDAAGFDFTQAQTGGRDIRFSKADGAPIAFQIERWDAQAERAEIWARLDSVAGGDAGQYINMHWGRSHTVTASEAVFTGSAGFATVYHLDEPANDDVGGYKDATPFANHATAASVNVDAHVPGIIAGAKAFAGKPLSTLGALTAALPNGFAGNPSFTVSFWMKYEPTATRQTILDFGTLATLKDMHFLLRRDSVTQFGPMDGELTSGSDPATWQNVFPLGSKAGKWCHVATVYDAASGRLTTYIDGVMTSQVPCPPLSLGAGDALRIGQALSTHPLDHPFNGALDEIRFCTRVLSADRIKLDFETQKP